MDEMNFLSFKLLLHKKNKDDHYLDQDLGLLSINYNFLSIFRNNFLLLTKPILLQKKY